MSWIMVDRLVGNIQRDCGSERLTVPQVTGEAGMRAAGDLEPEALSLLEVICGGPEFNLNLLGAVAVTGRLAGTEAQYTVAEIGRFA